MPVWQNYDVFVQMNKAGEALCNLRELSFLMKLNKNSGDPSQFEFSPNPALTQDVDADVLSRGDSGEGGGQWAEGTERDSRSGASSPWAAAAWSHRGRLPHPRWCRTPSTTVSRKGKELGCPSATSHRPLLDAAPGDISTQAALSCPEGTKGATDTGNVRAAGTSALTFRAGRRCETPQQHLLQPSL